MYLMPCNLIAKFCVGSKVYWILHTGLALETCTRHYYTVVSPSSLSIHDSRLRASATTAFNLLRPKPQLM